MARNQRKAVSVPRVDRERVIAVATPLVRIVAGILVCACLGALSWALYVRAMRSERFRIDPAALVGEGLPDWLPTAVAAEIGREVKSLPEHSIFEPGLAESLGGEIQRVSPWIRGVRDFERIFPNQARLALELERPVLTIEHLSKRYLIAANGRVLYSHSAEQALAFPFLVLDVAGIKLRSAPAVGGVLTDPNVRLAARAAVELSSLQEPYASILASIDPVQLDLDVAKTSAEYGKDEIFLRVRDNTVLIRFGRPRESDLGALENSVTRKLEFLKQILVIYPKLRGLADVRLDSNAPYYRELGLDKAWQYLEPETAP